MSKAAEEIEARRRERAFADFKRAWWWFDPQHRQHIHQFSSAWEILRRTGVYRLLYDKMRAKCSGVGRTEEHSFSDLRQTGTLPSQFREMFQQSSAAANELQEMVANWQTMIVNGWTPDKNYLEASEDSEIECDLLGGKTVRIPPIHGFSNQGVPVILPRQVQSSGHTSLVVELCKIDVASGTPPRIDHVAGPCLPTNALAFMHQHGKPIAGTIRGRFIAIEFPLHHPPKALKTLLSSGLNSIQRNGAWEKPLNDRDQYSRGPDLVTGTLTPFRVIAFFNADQPRNVVESGFATLLRPTRIKKILPRIRKEWIQWDCAEQVKYARELSRDKTLERARATWKKEAHSGRLAHQSTARPIRPEKDLDNLACADCASFHKWQRSQLPSALPERLRKDPDFNKRVGTGLRLIHSQDNVFLPLLVSAPDSV